MQRMANSTPEVVCDTAALMGPGAWREVPSKSAVMVEPSTVRATRTSWSASGFTPSSSMMNDPA